MQLAIQEQLVHDTSNKELATKTASEPITKTPAELAEIVVLFASSSGWLDRVRLRTEDRWYERLHLGPDYDLWVISWMPGQSTGFHDHGPSAGAFVVSTGVLEEHHPGLQTVVVTPGRPRIFGPDYAHDVRNVSLAPAVSIHAYSPPLSEMNEYELEGIELVSRKHASERAERLDQDWRAQRPHTGDRPVPLGIEHMLEAARSRLHRLTPTEALEAINENGAVLIDIRPEAQRQQEGSIPGALLVERNVLEWRLDPTSSARLSIATDHDLQVIVFCSEGYTSSLAAADLHDLGLWRATDIAGGYDAWRSAGLPVLLGG